MYYVINEYLIYNTWKFNYLSAFFINSLHAITTHDITVIQEPRISKLEGTSDQMIRPATMAPGTERYLIGAKTTASPNLNA